MAIGLVASAVVAGWFGFGYPETHGECVEDYVRDQESAAAAQILAGACRDLFAKGFNAERRQKRAKCLLDRVDGARTDAAARAAAASCPGGPNDLFGKP